MKLPISVAVLSLAALVPLAAQAPSGWKMRVDKSESASDPDAARILIGLGIDELSLSAARIPRIKAGMRSSSQPALWPLFWPVEKANWVLRNCRPPRSRGRSAGSRCA